MIDKITSRKVPVKTKYENIAKPKPEIISIDSLGLVKISFSRPLLEIKEFVDMTEKGLIVGDLKR